MPRKPQSESTSAPSKRATAKATAPAQKTQADAPSKRAPAKVKAPAQKSEADAPSKRAPAKARSTNGAKRSNVRAAQVSEGNTRKLTPKQKNEQLKQKLQKLLDGM